MIAAAIMRQAEQRIFRCDRFRRNGVQSGSGDLAAAQGFGKGGAVHKVAAGSVDDECTVLHARLPGFFQIKQIIPNAHAMDQLQFWQQCDQLRIRDIIGEGLTVQERREGKKLDRKAETSRLLELVGLPADFADRFPHELSGGQLQRVCIARAVACKPEIILFDEAISSLDAHTQVQVMDLLRELKDRLGLTYIFITHDLTSITYLCNDVLFLYQGRVTENLPVERISETKDEYARKLLESIVVFDTEESA